MLPSNNTYGKAMTGKRKVLVLGNDERSFLSVIRSLGRRGIEVHVGWCPKDSVALKSKYIKKIVNLVNYDMYNESWKKAFIELLKKENYDLVIPCNDQSIIPLQFDRSEILQYGRVWLVDEDIYGIVSNKAEISRLAKNLDINLPREEIIRKSDLNINNIIKIFNFPVIIKPCHSFERYDLTKKREVKKAYTKDQLEQYLEDFKNDEYLIIQENFIGKGLGIEILSDRGKLLYIFQHRRIHEPIGGGGSSYRKSERVNSELLGAVSKLIKKLNYTGVAMIEFKYNFEFNSWVLIEFNARFWGSLPLALSANADFPYFLYQFLVDKKYEFREKYKVDIYCRNLTKDLFWIFNNFHTNKQYKKSDTLSNLDVLMEIKNILLLRERSDTFAIDDLKPAFYELNNLTILIYKYFASLIKISMLSFLLFRNFEKKRLLKQLKKHNTILFICKGNICRGPLAERIAQRLLPSAFNVFSRGYINKSGRNSPKNAIEAAKELGVDLSTHKSQILENFDVRKAGILIVFDQENYFKLLDKYGNKIMKKMFYLGFLTEGSIIIKDPFGKDVNEYKKTFIRIIEAIEVLNKLCQISSI